jgi:FlaA1/EpsC-like NDP-sugar epimerase
LRFDFDVPDWAISTFASTIAWVFAVKLVVFWGTGQYRSWWGHVTFADLLSLFAAAFSALFGLYLLNQFLVLPHFVPRAVLLLDCFGTVLILGGLRSLWRTLSDYGLLSFERETYDRALLVGADHREKVLALYLHGQRKLPYRICGFLNNSLNERGECVGRVPVLGTIADLARVAHQRNVVDIIVIAGTLPGSELRKLRQQCEAAQLNLRILPPLAELVRADHLIPVREIDIEALLPRDPVQLDTTAVGQFIENGVVMVTGAGGSIGSELCRQILKLGPRVLLLVDRSEPSLFQIDLELRSWKASSEIVACLGDVTDLARMQHIFQQHRPTAVFHVAAHKHVPLLESHPSEAIKNNVFGTANLAESAATFGVKTFTYISTDKAVKPSSIMGVSKRLAENYVRAMGSLSATRFVTVRFGNVLGSAGSILPILQEQIRRGGPLTITHPEMIRYFMTIPKAAGLVLQAATIGQGGEVFVLDMGQPVKIVDLAKDLIVMSGLPEHAIEIVFTGPRPGEKLAEELYFSHEQPLPTGHPKLNAARCPEVSLSMMNEMLDELRLLVDRDDELLVAKLKQLVPEYLPPQPKPAASSVASESQPEVCHEVVDSTVEPRSDERTITHQLDDAAEESPAA